MLSLWKLRVGAEAYYLSQVAHGIDDYYSGAGESEGRWLGTGSEILSLPEAVTRLELATSYGVLHLLDDLPVDGNAALGVELEGHGPAVQL